MLLAKCCHDMDIMMWLMSPLKPITVSSVGARMQYRSENAPKNSGTYCLKDCPLVDTCQYSAKKIYIEDPYLSYPALCDAVSRYKKPFKKCNLTADKLDDLQNQLEGVEFLNFWRGRNFVADSAPNSCSHQNYFHNNTSFNALYSLS